VLPFELDGGGGGPRPVPASAQASLNTHDTFTFSAFVRGADVARREAAGLLEPESAREERERRRAAVSKLRDWLAARGYLSSSLEADRAGAGEPVGADGDEPGALLRACLRFLASSPAELLLVNLEDLWLEERPQNIPGTGSEGGGSWRRRAEHDLDELDGLPDVVEALAELQRMRPRRDR
jgi:4-alpha-glucanotransferase